MTNKIAIVEETEEEAEDGGMIIREAEDYFDKVYAVESKDLKFFFDDDEDVNDEGGDHDDDVGWHRRMKRVPLGDRY